jgi:hypothetical protein
MHNITSIEKGKTVDVVFVEEFKKKTTSFAFSQEKDQHEVYELSTNIWTNLRRAPPDKVTSPRLSRVPSEDIASPSRPRETDQGLPTEEDWNLMLQIAQEQTFQKDESITSEGNTVWKDLN